MYLEKINEIIKRSPESAERIADQAKIMVAYAGEVISHQIMQESSKTLLITDRIDGDEYRARMEMYNAARNKAHDKACEACQVINDIAAEKRCRKVFDFDLEPMKDQDGIFKGYSQDNHYKVNLYCAQFVNEFYLENSKEYNRNLMDSIAVPGQAYDEKELKDLPQKAKEWTNDLDESIIKPMLDEQRKGIKLKDGVILNIEDKNDDYSYSISLEGRSSVRDMAGDNFFYFEKGAYARDIPPAAIQDIVTLHGGLTKEKNIHRSHEQERG